MKGETYELIQMFPPVVSQEDEEDVLASDVCRQRVGLEVDQMMEQMLNVHVLYSYIDDIDVYLHHTQS